MIRPNSLPLVGKEKGNLKGFLLAKKKKKKTKQNKKSIKRKSIFCFIMKPCSYHRTLKCC